MAEAKAFHAAVTPAILKARALPGGPAKIVEIPERDQTMTPMMRIEATRQWLIKQGDLGKKAAEVLMEQAVRLQAVRSYVTTSFPDGQIKSMITKILDGKITAIPM